MPRATFRDLYNRGAPPEMSPADRERARILFVEADATARNHLRTMLNGLGYTNLIEAPNHMTALQKLGERKPTHVIFEAKKTNMPVDEFLVQVVKGDSGIIAIPTSADPTIDDVFGLLTLGARGYIVKPFNADAIEEAIGLATKGEGISEAILFARDRNEALASLIGASLGQLATAMRQAPQYESAAREVPKRLRALERSVSMGRFFADGGDDALVNAIMEFCIERGEGPASKLGRIRKRLEAKKVAHQEKLASQQNSAEDTQQSAKNSDKANGGAEETVSPQR